MDEGNALKGTAGALRLVVDHLEATSPIYVLYGDSLLDVPIGDVTTRFLEVGLPALMTVFRNEGRWEESNAIFDGRIVTHYEKHPSMAPEQMVFVDYGLLIFESSYIRRVVPAGEFADLAEFLGRLSRAANWRAMKPLVDSSR